jgi:acetylornithine/succinyldiaminopimelate/putrescine aminotransferase
MKTTEQRDHIAVDQDGRTLPFTPAQVQQIVEKMIADGTIHAVIVENADGDLGVQVFGPPSRRLLDTLESAAKAYANVLRGH